MTASFVPAPGRKPSPDRTATLGKSYRWKGKEGIFVWQPEGEPLGTVVFVHGVYDNAETSWNGDYGSFKEAYHKPGLKLQEQFEMSGLKAFFIVPEAEIQTFRGEEVVWRDLQSLLDAAKAPRGPVAVLSHSEGYFTTQNWLTHPDLVHISLLDSLYGFVEQYADWLGAKGHSIDLVGSGSTRKNCQAIVDKHRKEEIAEDTTPPVLAPSGSGPDPLQAKILWMKSPYDHMTLVNGKGKAGPLIPALLKRAEAALRRAAGQPAQTQAAKPMPAVFEATAEDDPATHHVLDNPLKSWLKDTADLARMASRKDRVLKKGTALAEAVKAVRKAINQLLGTEFEESGSYGPDVEKAARDFQTRWNGMFADRSLSTDGRVGPNTLLALDEALLLPSFGAPAAQSKPSAVQQKPAPPASGQYELSTDGAQRFTFEPGDPRLSAAPWPGGKRVSPPAPPGDYYRFPKAPAVENKEHRPLFALENSNWPDYAGPGGDGAAAGYKGSSPVPVHPVLVDPLGAMLQALIDEGTRIGDQSMKSVIVRSGWRSATEDGVLFLKELKDKMREKPKNYGSEPFPAALEAEAKSNLGSKSAQVAFQKHLAEQPGWSSSRAEELWNDTTQHKAPGGGSSHESGLVVDIDFPFVNFDVNPKSKAETVTVQWHHISRFNNAQARLSGAGMWLAQHSKKLDFSSYDTRLEIWHMEWLVWKGTAADPRIHGA